MAQPISTESTGFRTACGISCFIFSLLFAGSLAALAWHLLPSEMVIGRSAGTPRPDAETVAAAVWLMAERSAFFLLAALASYWLGLNDPRCGSGPRSQ